MYWVLLWLLTSQSFTDLCFFIDKVQVVQVILAMFIYLSIRKRYWCLLESVVLIDGIYKSCRKIDSGVVIKSDELMSDIKFWTTPKFDMTPNHNPNPTSNPHPEPLGA